MDLHSKVDLVKKGTTIEILTQNELEALFETNNRPKHYIGFEISGQVHIATGLLTALKLKDFMAAGIKPTIFLADYHAWINGKLGGDLEKIQQVAKGYFKHSFISLGLEEPDVKYVFASELYDELGKDFWKDVLQISKDTTMARMLRCTTIMGRSEKEQLSSAAILYPAMQAADIWALDVDIAGAGMDQRKVHVLSREISEKFKRKKAVAVHGKLLPGLTGPGRMDAGATEDEKLIANKMSKSNPDSCLFITDSKDEIKRKLKKAYCPQEVVDENPIIEYAEAFILRDRPLKIQRPEKFGGDVEFASSAELKQAFSAGKLHPMDLKNAVGAELARMLEPSRKYFEKHSDYLSHIKAASVGKD